MLVGLIGNPPCYSGCLELRTVTLDSAITFIGNSAFAASGLTSIRLLQNVTTLGTGVFQNCSNLTAVDMQQSSITVIPTDSFASCTRLATLQFPAAAGLTTIGTRAFASCSTLGTTITLPSTIERISNEAFDQCTGLVAVQSTSTVLISVGPFAFRGCRRLANVISIQLDVALSPQSFPSCLGVGLGLAPGSARPTVLTCVPCITTGNALTLPDGVVSITSQAFAGCTEIRQVG